MVDANLISSAVALIIFRFTFEINESYTYVNRATTPLKVLAEIPNQACTYTVMLNDTVFRLYACTNAHEFFTVAVGTFFSNDPNNLKLRILKHTTS